MKTLTDLLTLLRCVSRVRPIGYANRFDNPLRLFTSSGKGSTMTDMFALLWRGDRFRTGSVPSGCEWCADGLPDLMLIVWAMATAIADVLLAAARTGRP
jgi:hypothetical protein